MAMASTRYSTIRELDCVSLLEPIEKYEEPGQWPVGTVGVVISDHRTHKTVEIANEMGEMLDMPTVPIEQLEFLSRPRPSLLSRWLQSRWIMRSPSRVISRFL